MTVTLSGSDELLQVDLAFYHTHPGVLARVAVLNGLDPAPPDGCRVLELGCGTGSNLLPMTQSLPGSTFVGVDLASALIARGQEVVREVGIGNLDLRAMDLAGIDASWGQFDYIVAHGLFSWVGPAIQDRILSVCKHSLAPHGVAYISYNTLPGWRVRGVVRDLLLYHGRGADTPQELADRSWGVLERWQGALDEKGDLFTRLLRQEVDALMKESTAELMREFLADYNDPLYFSHFMERAEAAGLQYLGEARLETMAAFQPAGMRGRLEGFSRRALEQEQYHDFIRHRCFRQTLLCHAEVALEQRASLTRLGSLRVKGIAAPIIPLIDYYSPAPVRFQLPDRTHQVHTEPLFKTMLLCLKEAGPGGLGVEGLWHRVRDRLAHPPVRTFATLLRDPQDFLRLLLDGFRQGQVDLEGWRPPAAERPGDSPLAPALFRYQAARGQDVTSLCHRPVALGPVDRLLLAHLDGRHDRAALLAVLTDASARQPELFADAGGEHQPPGPAELGSVLEARLDHLAREAVLLG